jgi:RNA polymerase sigma-70 factor (ECF subfamily)
MDDETVALAAMLARDLDQHFPLLVQRYQAALYRFALRLGADPHEAEDIVQEAFLRSYVALVHYPASHIGALHLRPWLYKIALHAIRNGRRRALATCSLEGAEASRALDASDDEALQPERWLAALERRHDLEEAMARLRERYRDVLVCIFSEQLSYQETATLLDIPLGTVRSRTHRGIKALQTMLCPEGKEIDGTL